jgi:hypothetical protein
MTLLEIAAKLEEVAPDGIIFAARIEDEFRPESNAMVLTLSEEELKSPVGEAVQRRCPGLECCLEVSIAKDAVRVWSRWHGTKTPSHLDAARARAICHKATYDAWGPPEQG